MAGNNAIKFLRGTAGARKNSSETLNQGQPFYETDTGLLYCGENINGVNLKAATPVYAGGIKSAVEFDASTGDYLTRYSCGYDSRNNLSLSGVDVDITSDFCNLYGNSMIYLDSPNVSVSKVLESPAIAAVNMNASGNLSVSGDFKYHDTKVNPLMYRHSIMMYNGKTNASTLSMGPSIYFQVITSSPDSYVNRAADFIADCKDGPLMYLPVHGMNGTYYNYATGAETATSLRSIQNLSTSNNTINFYGDGGDAITMGIVNTISKTDTSSSLYNKGLCFVAQDTVTPLF